MADHSDTRKKPPTSTGPKSEQPSELKTWSDIAREFGVSRQRVKFENDRLLAKLRDIIRNDPLLKEWAEENGYEVE